MLGCLLHISRSFLIFMMWLLYDFAELLLVGANFINCWKALFTPHRCSIMFILVNNLWFHSLLRGWKLKPYSKIVCPCASETYAVSVHFWHFCGILKVFPALLCSRSLSISCVLVCCFHVFVQFTMSLCFAIVQMDLELSLWGKVSEAFPYLWISIQKLK